MEVGVNNFIGPKGGATRFKMAQAPGQIVMWPHPDGQYYPYRVDEIKQLRAREEELERDLKWAWSSQKCKDRHITNEQIDAAWGLATNAANPPVVGAGVMVEMLKIFGIKRHGDGWIKE